MQAVGNDFECRNFRVTIYDASVEDLLALDSNNTVLPLAGGNVKSRNLAMITGVPATPLVDDFLPPTEMFMPHVVSIGSYEYTIARHRHSNPSVTRQIPLDERLWANVVEDFPSLAQLTPDHPNPSAVDLHRNALSQLALPGNDPITTTQVLRDLESASTLLMEELALQNKLAAYILPNGEGRTAPLGIARLGELGIYGLEQSNSPINSGVILPPLGRAALMLIAARMEGYDTVNRVINLAHAKAISDNPYLKSLCDVLAPVLRRMGLPTRLHMRILRVPELAAPSTSISSQYDLILKEDDPTKRQLPMIPARGRR